MATNSVRIQVTLEGDKAARAGLASLGKQMQSLSTGLGKVGKTSVWKDIALGSMAASAGIGAITAAANVAGKAVGALTGLFSDYARTQSETVMATGSVMGALDVSFDQARTIIRGFTSQLGQETSKYGADLAKVQDAANVGLDDLLKVLTEAGVTATDASKQSATLFSKLQAVAGNDLTNMQLSQVVPNLLENELASSKDFFNSQIVGYMEDYLGKVGKTLETSTATDRVKALEYALEKKLPDSVTAQMQGTVTGIMASFKNLFTNIDTGILALDRDLDGDASNGIQSVGASFTRVVGKIFGSDGLFSRIGKILGKLGIDDTVVLDTMASALGTLGGWLDSINKFLESVQEALTDANQALRGTGLKPLDLGAGLTLIRDLVTRKIGEWIGSITKVTSLGTFQVSDIGTQVGRTVKGWLQGAIRWVKDALPDWNTLANESFNVGAAIGETLGRLAWEIGNIDTASAVSVLGKVTVAAISALGGMLSGAILTVGRNLVDTFLSNSAREFAAVGGMIQELGAGLANAAIGFFNSVTSAINSAKSQLPFGLGNVLGDAPTIPKVETDNSPVGVRGMASGTLGIVGNLLSAAKSESQRMPPGAGLVMANSSEAVLNQTQLGDLGRLLGNRNTQPAVAPVTFNNTFQITEASNAQAVAREVIKTIEAQVRSVGMRRTSLSY